MFRKQLPQAGAEAASVAPEAVARQEARKERPARVDWAELLKRTFDFDVFVCLREVWRQASGAGVPDGPASMVPQKFEAPLTSEAISKMTEAHLKLDP